MDWVDSLVTSVSSDRSKVYTITGNRDHGNFKNLSEGEFVEVLLKLKQWVADIHSNG